ncbi:putative bacteriocin export ABC transporter [Streptococcus ruminantium]|uniref:Bacteriocin export ABC transporter n=1 Tax=Streptococcus ruminantium TaxID=1917441 RepID=A0ABU1B4P4_9STRE|nr:putative bacteriocin export ABC transporter [Streptococcus ruminantium]MDQ8758994.1 putative bacteriocin export ABC transporter [Streptococcus ruminantium]MDQ8769120.1 putative bacteriocin export ABC transporter [Streptococcus ruminantium]MDQ8775376.1 putative bacteriocin export ABC transporter [Streptococcus ruminantium]MDQ8793633.1 putative bacteriocin export ABC transporter [Streptococcus ruminantium]MDQ8795366.1 putative bacteriocin export ABC transporter [Streptococcus ruminantium]
MIELKQVSKSFGERKLFLNLSMIFEAGKVYALIGSSGSGKTTLMNMMGKLESYDGNIVYRDKDLNSYKSSDFFRHELGYLFQNFGLIENQTIEENLKLGLIGQKLSKSEQQVRQKQALEQVGLFYLNLDKRIFELSGGESQRVALAKVILKNPPFILADEPTASIDPATSQLIMEMLLSLRDDNRLIIIATHNLAIWEMADEVITMDSLK